MAISSEKTLLSLLAAGIFMSFPNLALASTPDAGVSRALAEARANRIANTRYRLSFSLKEHGSTVDGSETVTFESNSAGDLAIDYRDGVLLTATLNGHTIPIELKNGHLILPVVAGANIFTATFVSNAAPAGKAMTRYEDKDDGSEYFYTLFVPIDASMAFPCFDQPDLKAKFSVDVQHPAGWSASQYPRQSRGLDYVSRSKRLERGR